MSLKTETSYPTNEEEAEEWLRENKLAAEHTHEDSANAKAAIELGLNSAEEIDKHKEH